MKAMNMVSLNISLPRALRKYVEQQVATGDWGTATEFVRDLIRRHKERRQNPVEEPQTSAPKPRRRARRVDPAVKSGLAVMEELIAQRRAAERAGGKR
jgi:putative addiction module CopG family antidote